MADTIPRKRVFRNRKLGNWIVVGGAAIRGLCGWVVPADLPVGAHILSRYRIRRLPDPSRRSRLLGGLGSGLDIFDGMAGLGDDLGEVGTSFGTGSGDVGDIGPGSSELESTKCCTEQPRSPEEDPVHQGTLVVALVDVVSHVGYKGDLTETRHEHGRHEPRVGVARYVDGLGSES